MDARARFRRFVPPGQRMVDALLEKRRAEEAQEDAALGFSEAPVEGPLSGDASSDRDGDRRPPVRVSMLASC